MRLFAGARSPSRTNSWCEKPFSHPDERPGKTYIFPHLFAEVMDAYMKKWGVSERDLAQIAVIEYARRIDAWWRAQGRDAWLAGRGATAPRAEGVAA